jgi:hypothetical protein
MAIHNNITYEQYDKLPGLRASTLKPYLQSPKHGKQAELKTFSNKAMNMGTLTHAMVLEGQKAADKLLSDHFITDAPVNPKTGKPYGPNTDRVKNWLAANPDKKYIDPADLGRCSEMRDAVLNHDKAVDILSQCHDREFAVTWIDELTGIECKALVDFCGNNIAGDLKTTSANWNVSALEKTNYDFGYHMQFSFYMDGLKANGFDIEEFYVIYVQNSYNPDVCVGCINYTALEQGQTDYHKAINNRILAQDIELEHCPGKFPDIIDIGVPYWAVEEFEPANSLHLDWSN